MEVGLKEWSEVRSGKYQLPQIVYRKGSYYLDSSAELAGLQEHNRPSFVFKNDKIVHEARPQPRQNLPSAKEMTSITFMGERRNHPSLRMRLYEVLQH